MKASLDLRGAEVGTGGCRLVDFLSQPRELRFMATTRKITYVVFGAAIWAASTAWGQIVINEVMKEERTAGGGTLANTREFIELYNAGNAPVDLNNWSLVTYDIAGNTPESFYTITGAASTIIPAHGYYVIGDSGVPNVNFTPPGAPAEMWPDIKANAIILRDGDPFTSNVIDAVAYDMYRNGATGTSLLPAELTSQIGSGFEGSPISPNAAAGQTRISWARYRDGVDTNKNGLDFGTLPLTPGTTNNTLPQSAALTIPNVDSMAVGTVLSDYYYGAFELGRVIDPTVATAINPRAIPASPQGGKAIIAWDQTGGGNSVYSKELVNKFELYAYVDTDPLGVAATTVDREYETSSYGIGSIDPLFENPDPSGTINPGEAGFGAATRNGSTGVGWVFHQFETDLPADGTLADVNKAYLVDFGDSGDSRPTSNEWKIKAEIDLTGKAAGWVRLGIDYNPATRQVTARYGTEVYQFTLDYDLIGTFNVGYREGITGAVSNNLAKHNPAIFDLYQAGVSGDYNGNGKVDGADYVVWRNGGAPDSGPGGYALWRQNFGAGSGAGSLSGAAVPEPGTLALIAFGMMVYAGSRRAASR